KFASNRDAFDAAAGAAGRIGRRRKWHTNDGACCAAASRRARRTLCGSVTQWLSYFVLGRATAQNIIGFGVTRYPIDSYNVRASALVFNPIVPMPLSRHHA